MPNLRPPLIPKPTTRDLIEFAAAEGNRAGNAEARIRTTFGVSSARYHQMLYAAAQTPEALEIDAVTTNRINRLRVAKRAQRTNPFTPQHRLI